MPRHVNVLKCHDNLYRTTHTEATMKNYQNLITEANYIGHTWLKEGSGEFLDVIDKYRGNSLAKLPLASEEQMEHAIQCAIEGFHIYKKWSAGMRSNILLQLRDLIAANSEALAQLIVDEAGKPLGYAQGEISRCITTVEIAAREALTFSGEMVPIDFSTGTGKTAFTKPFPIGSIACITPFNFPLNLVLHKVAPALATGCSVIVKPAPQTPLSTIALGALIEQLDLPKGVFNIVNCDIPVAEKMVRDDRIAKLSFTGSEKVGWYLKSIIGKKRVTLELGGNAAVIIDETADIETAAKTTAIGAYLYAGQICISTQRILVHKNVSKSFMPLLINEIEALKVGDPSDKNVMIGPIIEPLHLKRIDEWVKEALQGGAKILTGGKIVDEKHNLYAPTLLTGTTTNMKVNCAEVFGPIAIVEEFNDFNEAIAMVNDSPYGLQAGIYSNSFKNITRAHEELEVGGVIVNNVPGFRIDNMPYGGVKNSGFGREGIKYAMKEMTEQRLLVY